MVKTILQLATGNLLKSKSSQGLCAIKYCRNKREPQRTTCRRCRRWLLIINNPISYLYSALKQRVKTRGIPFSLTLEEFTIFCQETNYHTLKGNNKDSYTIDRKRVEEGYTFDNITIAERELNVMRRNYVEYHKNKLPKDLNEKEYLEWEERKKKFNDWYSKYLEKKNQPAVVAGDEDVPF